MPELSRSVSLRDLMAAGIAIQPHEAVTIVQQVCRYLAWKGSAGESIRVPPLDEIRIDAAGEAAITDLKAADALVSVPDLARLLEHLLPPPGRDQRRVVPGPLRFTIARALGEVDARPFASPAEFSTVLARFEREAPRQAIGALFDRWRAAGIVGQRPAAVLVDGKWAVDAEGFRERRRSDAGVPTRPAPAIRVDRRRHAPSADAFRMMLREADQRVFESNRSPRGAIPVAAPTDEAPTPSRERRGHPADAATFRRMLREADRAMYERRVATGEILAPDARAEVSASLPVVTRRADVVAEYMVAESVALDTVPHRRNTAFGSHGRLLGAAAALFLMLAAPVAWRMAHPSAGRRPSPAPAASATTPTPETREAASGALSAPAHRRPSPAPMTKPRADADALEPESADPAAPQLVLASNADGAALFSPSFDSNGSAVFFHEGKDPAALMRADTSPDGTVLHVTSIVDDGAKNYHVRLSPDEQSLAFDSDRDGVRGVYVATREGKDVHRVSGNGFAALPSWSPDAGRLAFVKAEPDKPQVWNLWLHDLRTGDERRLTDYPYGQLWSGSWFADGRRMCYSHETALYILDLESGNTKRYPSPVRGHLVRTPAVSPDGRRVVFQVHRDGVWLLDLATGSMRRILSDPTAEEFTWAPDGRRVAFHSHRAGGWALWVLGT